VRGTGAGIGHHLLVIASPIRPRRRWTMSYAATAMVLQGDRLRLAGLDGALLPADARRRSRTIPLSILLPMSRACSGLRARPAHGWRRAAPGPDRHLRDFLWFRDVLDLPSPPAALAVRANRS
jgi:hypothetical protein